MAPFPPAPAALPLGLRPGGRFSQWRPRRPRYVVLDVDGTLLGQSGVVTEPVTAAASACVEAGLAVGLATGRMPRACASLARAARLSGPHVVHNGAMVVNSEPIRTWPLDRPRVDALLDVCRRRNLYAEVYVGDGYWVTNTRPEARTHWDMLGADPEGTVECCDLDRVIKASVLLFDEPVEETVAAIEAVGVGAAIAHSPTMPGVSFVNVTTPGVDKGVALEVAAQHLGCDLTEVMAVGDAPNDLSMLAIAGTAVAMGQAPLEIREAAHLIVPEIEYDGVAHALQAALAWNGGGDSGV